MLEADDVQYILVSLLEQYGVDFEREDIEESAIFKISKFGVKVVYLNGQPFKKTILTGWLVAWVHPDYSIDKAREIIIYTLMEGGYFHYLRFNFPNVYKRIISMEGWDREILEERLRRYKELPKYNYFRELDNDALTESSTYILAVDPGFFDFMPS